MEKQKINIPCIQLEWSKWFEWQELNKDARSKGGIKVPSKKAGVYEVKYENNEERFTIGKASDLRTRIVQ